MSELIVRVADLAVGERGDVLVTVGLGSCVAILLHDADAGVGGLAHVLLPAPSLAPEFAESSSQTYRNRLDAGQLAALLDGDGP